MVRMVKNIEHPNLTFSSPKEEDEHSRHFQGGVSTPPPSPISEGPSLAARLCHGQRAGITHSLLAIENFKNLGKINISGRRVFFSRRHAILLVDLESTGASWAFRLCGLMPLT